MPDYAHDGLKVMPPAAQDFFLRTIDRAETSIATFG
jgi:hypothetical protein